MLVKGSSFKIWFLLGLLFLLDDNFFWGNFCRWGLDLLVYVLRYIFSGVLYPFPFEGHVLYPFTDLITARRPHHHRLFSLLGLDSLITMSFIVDVKLTFPTYIIYVVESFINLIPKTATRATHILTVLDFAPTTHL